MKKIVKFEIVDPEIGESLETYYLINPDLDILSELKEKIERRFNYQTDENLSEKEREEAEAFSDNIWDKVDEFIRSNFNVLDIDEIVTANY